MLPTHDTQHVEEARALLISQFKNRRVIQGMLDAFVRQLQILEDTFWDIIDGRVLDDATNAQLVSLGKLVGEKPLNRTNDEFRAAIRLRIRVNRSKGRITDIIDVAILAALTSVPRVTEYRYLGFEVEIYGQVGERYVAELLNKTRAASSQGLFTTSDLPYSGVLAFDDAVSPGAGLQTFSDSVSGTGNVAASGYGLPSL